MFIPPPVIMVFAIIAMFYGRQFLPGLAFAFEAQQLFGVVIAIIGALFAIISVQRFKKVGTTFQPHKLDEAKHLITDGLYTRTRNPMYLGMAIIIFAVGIYLGTLLVLPVLAIFVVVITKFQIKPEEEALEKIFGQEFRDFKARVRRWI